MSSMLTNHPPTSHTSRRLRRVAAVIAAVIASLAFWAIAVHVIGINLRSPAFGRTQAPAAISAATVALVSGLAGLAAWGLLAFLERTTRRPRQIWTAIALAALALSLAAPLSGHGASGASRIVLACLHLLVAATLITVLGRTAAAHEIADSHEDPQPGPSLPDGTLLAGP